MLYIADEIFFTGTAAEISPVRSVDGVTIGSGSRGPITHEIQSEYFSLITGEVPDRHGWLTPVR
jgi:branched-chain amino acid aminotransferase